MILVFKDMEFLKIANIYKGTTKKYGKVTCRSINSFVFRISGVVRYTFADSFLDVHAGEFIFLPQGESYSYEALTDEPCEYVSISFSADFGKVVPAVYPTDGFQEEFELQSNLTDLWKFGNKAGIYKCYAFFYNLLSYIENFDNLKYTDKKKLSIINPAILYLKSHIYDCDLKIENLIQICGISGTYFQKIFQNNFGVSPQKYILGKRLSRAKAIIDSGEFDTVFEVAVSVGYNDPLYFSRAFKKKYGVSPIKYIKR